ncbi:MAG: hypothetical protein ACO3QO_01205 [Candidatus Kapaibacteriota bacterium]
MSHVSPWITMAIALLIGALVGAERETRQTDHGPVRFGVRDFVITSA